MLLILIVYFILLLCVAGQATLPITEYTALQDLYNSTDGNSWTWRNSTIAGPEWFTNEYPCGNSTWQGLTCECEHDKCKIISIELDSYQLAGTLPNSIGNFSVLRKLDLSMNSLEGELPSGLFELRVLTNLRLYQNKISGNLSESIGNLENLVELTLHHNNFYGSLPSSIGFLSHLEQLGLEVNLFHGTLPPTIFGLHKLGNLSLEFNLFTGEIPEAIGGLTRLVSFSIYDNNFNGTLPSSLGTITSMKYLYLTGNKFSGTVPESFYSLTELKAFVISHNKLTGTISPLLGNLTNVEYLYFDVNDFTSSLPDSIRNCKKLKSFAVNGNKLTGTIPESVYDLNELFGIYLYDNLFHGTLSNNLGNLRFLVAFNARNNLFTGTIPASLKRLNRLRTFNIGFNYLNGTIPEDIFYLTDLRYLTVFANQLTGTLSSRVENLVNLTRLDISVNNLHGTIPEALYSCLQLNTLYLDNNTFTGTISESVGNLQLLTQLYVEDNLFTGTLPENIRNLNQLISLSFYNNSFTGTLTDGLCHLEGILGIYGQNNFLSGSIPNCLFSDLPHLIDLVLYYNRLTGVLPLNITGDALSTIQVNDNQLTGQLPELVTCPFFNIFEVTSNLLSGTIPYNFFGVTHYQQLFLETNLLTGSIPTSIGYSKSAYLDLSSNILTGSLPSTISYNSGLQKIFVNKNALSGSVSCFNNMSYLTNIELSNNHFTGTIPYEVFDIEVLETFASVENCFTGSLSESICSARSLTALSLDGLHTASSCRIDLLSKYGINTYTLDYYFPGSIPACLFNISTLSTLHITGNGFKTSLPSSLVISNSLINLAISYNEIYGSIPTAITEKSFDSLDLSYNRFTGELPDTLLVQKNASLYLDVNRMSGKIPLSLRNIEDIEILDGNIFVCDYERSTLPKHDSRYSYYECGTSDVQQSIYAWITLVGLVATVGLYVIFIDRFKTEKADTWIQVQRRKAVSWLNLFNNPDKTISNIQTFGSFCVSLRSIFAVLTIVILLMILPIDVGVSYYSPMYQYQYAWSVSSVYTTGIVPGMILLVSFVLFICIAFGTFYIYLVNFHKQKTVHRSSARIERKNTIESNISVDEGSMNNNESSTNYKHYLCLIGVGLFNFCIVLTINIFYVVITTKYSPIIVVICQIFLSGFKLLWNDFAIRGLTILAHNYSTNEISLSPKQERALEGKYMSFNICTLIFNIIVIPCLAAATVSSDCFYDVFFPPDNVESSYSYSTCATLQTAYELEKSNCTQFVDVTTTTSYLPPFVYSYQCSSTIITTYAVLYVYNFILAAFGQPLLFGVLMRICRYLNRESTLYQTIQLILPRLFKSDVTLQADKRVFYKDRFNLRMSMYLSVFMTFDVIFPPLAVVICVAVVMQSYFTEFSIGRFVDRHSQDAEQELKVLQTIDNDCASIGDLFKLTVTFVGPISAMFYSFIIFDTYGDAVGGLKAIWAFLFILLFGCVVSVLYYRLVKRDIEDIPNFGKNVEIEMKNNITFDTIGDQINMQNKFGVTGNIVENTNPIHPNEVNNAIA